MTPQSSPILISLKPEYASLIFKGLKKAELRRRISMNLQNRDVFVYVSSPIRELRGGFRVGEVWSGSPNEIWSMVSKMAGVTRNIFNEYYHGQNVAYALEILDVWQYDKPLGLNVLRSKYPGFYAPQSYRFIRPIESRSMRRLKKTRIDSEQRKTA